MSEFAVMTMDQIKDEASKLGCEVVLAAPNQLQFDLDDAAALETFEHFYHIKLGTRFKQLLPREGWKSKSGNDHIVVTLPEEIGVEKRIAMQAMGGSDYGREFAALCCHWDGSPHPVLLFKPRPEPIPTNVAPILDGETL